MNKEELPINGTYARNVLLEDAIWTGKKSPQDVEKRSCGDF